MIGDLHVHSTYSDGTNNINEINKLAQQKNINYIAITDHDTINSFKEIKELNTPIKFIYGVEMKGLYKNETIHILGYFKEYPKKEVFTFFNKLKESRLKRCYKIIKKLKTYYNININIKDILEFANNTIGRPHIANAIAKKYNLTYEEAFKKYLTKESKAYVRETTLTIEEVISFLKENNALIIIAHPIQIKTFNYQELIKYDFDGIEAYHSDQDEQYTEQIIDFAHKNNLIITGGSDYHGLNKNIPLGNKTINNKDLEIFINKLKEK